MKNGFIVAGNNNKTDAPVIPLPSQKLVLFRGPLLREPKTYFVIADHYYRKS